MNPLNIKVKYLTEQPPLEFVAGKSDWIDLRAAKDIYLVEGQSTLIPLGVAIKLPEGYEAHLAPRSSTFNRWGIIQTNSVGVIDESYSGDKDEWKMPVLCMVPSCYIAKGDRVAQFRIMPKMGYVPVIGNAVKTIENLNGDIIGTEMINCCMLEQVGVEFEAVDHLSDKDRGGFGSTGTN